MAVKAQPLDLLTNTVIGVALEVHKNLGPGFNERIYVEALMCEFDARRIRYEKEKAIKVAYKGRLLGEQRLDFLIDGQLILEIKAAGQIGSVDLSQIISYLKAADKKLGLILNFGTSRLAIKRVIN